MTLHITPFEGGSALSPFRVQQLLPGLQAIHDRVTGLAARFVHLVTSDAVPDVNPLNPKYRLMINVWSKLPLPVANCIGPFLARSLG